jgi:hypothetical protein
VLPSPSLRTNWGTRYAATMRATALMAIWIETDRDLGPQ